MPDLVQLGEARLQLRVSRHDVAFSPHSCRLFLVDGNLESRRLARACLNRRALECIDLFRFLIK
jgi:hypothetical protein